MADISKIVLPDDSIYNFKDATLRDTISDLVVKSTSIIIDDFSKDNVALANYQDDNPVSTSQNITITKSGYTPLGIVGTQLANASTNGVNVSWAQLIGWNLSSSTTASVTLASLARTNGTKVKITVYVLYMKN